ncbi:MAG: MarR family transcriptional regulator [Myxococcaceae bacterium]|nr:MarR family transcriptional regulator [Myxococcaceae bacterium]
MVTTGPSSAPADPILELDNQFCFALHSAARRVVRAYRPALTGLDVTYPQYLVMLVVWQWDAEGHTAPTVTALCERLDLETGTLTPLLRRLEQKKLIVRSRGSDDARELYVRVTDVGRSLKEHARSVPLSLVQGGQIPLHEIFSLRDQLKRLRDSLPR